MNQIQTFDIPVNIRVVAKDEATAEQLVLQYLRLAEDTISDPDIGDYELFEFVPSELAKSCCC